MECRLSGSLIRSKMLVLLCRSGRDVVPDDKTISSVFRGRALPIYLIPFRKGIDKRCPGHWLAEHVLFVLLALWPMLAIPFVTVGLARSARVTGVLVVDFVVLECILATWHQYDRAATAPDDALSTHKSEAHKISNYLARVLSPCRQLAFCILVGACFSLAVFLPGRPFYCAAALSYLAAMSTGLVVGQALYLNLATFGLGRIVRDLSVIDVNQVRPWRTPGIVELSRAVQTQAKAGFLLLALIIVPVTFSYLRSKSTSDYVILLTMTALGVCP